ncbi:MAG: hypothetical protein EU542_07155 [Promethearchaeota archaeon]|nr:MAG: hypothetical protein EU542_07155 [Candidatus Lokiarchaeota archaeon]
MTDIKFTISKDIIERMKKYPEIDWERVAKSAVEKYLEKLEVADKLLSNSKLTLKDAEKLGEDIKQKMWEKHKLYLENLEE